MDNVILRSGGKQLQGSLPASDDDSESSTGIPEGDGRDYDDWGDEAWNGRVLDEETPSLDSECDLPNNRESGDKGRKRIADTPGSNDDDIDSADELARQKRDDEIEFINNLVARCLVYRQNATDAEMEHVWKKTGTKGKRIGIGRDGPPKNHEEHFKILHEELCIWEDLEQYGMEESNDSGHDGSPDDNNNANKSGGTKTRPGTPIPKCSIKQGQEKVAPFGTNGHSEAQNDGSVSGSKCADAGQHCEEGCTISYGCYPYADDFHEPAQKIQKTDETGHGGKEDKISGGSTIKCCDKCSYCWAGDELTEDEHRRTIVEVHVTCIAAHEQMEGITPPNKVIFFTTINNHKNIGFHKLTAMENRVPYWQKSRFYESVRTNAERSMREVFPFNVFKSIGLDHWTTVEKLIYHVHGQGLDMIPVIVDWRDIYKDKKVMSKLNQPMHRSLPVKGGEEVKTYDSLFQIEMICYFDSHNLIDRQINYVDDMFAQRLKHIILDTREDTDILKRLAKILYAVHEFSHWEGDTHDRIFERDYMKLKAPFGGIAEFPRTTNLGLFPKFSKEKLGIQKPQQKDLVIQIKDEVPAKTIGVKSTKIKTAKLSKPMKKAKRVKDPEDNPTMSPEEKDGNVRRHCDDCDYLYPTNPEKKATKSKKPKDLVKKQVTSKKQVKIKTPDVSRIDPASLKKRAITKKRAMADAIGDRFDSYNSGKRISSRNDPEQRHGDIDGVESFPSIPGKYDKLKKSSPGWHGMQLISGTADKEDYVIYETTPTKAKKRYLNQKDDWRWTQSSEGENRNFEGDWRQKYPVRKLRDDEDPWKRSNYYDRLIPRLAPERKPKKTLAERLGPKTVSEGFTKAERRLFNPAPVVVKGNFTRRLG